LEVVPDDAAVSVGQSVKGAQVVDEVGGAMLQDAVEAEEQELREHVVLQARVTSGINSLIL
jgi:hypothetical protein